MQGIVATVPGASAGIICGDDGRRYEFDLAGWNAKAGPRGGLKVYCKPDGGRACRILRLPGRGTAVAGTAQCPGPIGNPWCLR